MPGSRPVRHMRKPLVGWVLPCAPSLSAVRHRPAAVADPRVGAAAMCPVRAFTVARCILLICHERALVNDCITAIPSSTTVRCRDLDAE